MPTINTQSWMNQLAYDIKVPGFLQVPLCQMALPGTHDSGTYAIPADVVTMELTPDAETAVRGIFWAGGIAGQLIVRNWAVTQTRSLTDQMNGGARYLDFRVTGTVLRTPAMISETISPALCHSLRSISVANALDQVATFLKTNNREVVIIDFQHFYTMSASQHSEVVTLLRQKLGSMMVNPQTHGANVTLQQLAAEFASVGRAIVLYGDDAVAAANPDILWPRSRITSPWASSATNFSALENYLNTNTFPLYPSASTFVVAQGILSAGTSDYVTNSSVISFSSPSGAEISAFQYRGIGANVVMVDELSSDSAKAIIRNNIPPAGLKITLGETSDNGPGLAMVGDKLHMAWRATNENHIVYSTTSDGVCWSPSYRVTANFQSTGESPAMCEFQGKAWVAWKATDSSGSVCVAPVNGGAGNWVVKCGESAMTTASRPSIVVFHNKLHVFWRATNQDHLVYAVSSDGINWQGSYMAGPSFNTSPSGPSVTVWQDKLYMAWRATNADHLVYAIYDGANWSESLRICQDFQTSASAPAIMGGNDGFLYVSWRATSSNETLMYARYNGAWSGPWAVQAGAGVNQATDAGPSLAWAFNQAVVGWKGKGNANLNVGSVISTN